MALNLEWKQGQQIFEVLEKFGEDLEDSRSDRIYSSGNRRVKKGPGPRGSRDEEFLVPCSKLEAMAIFVVKQAFVNDTIMAASV